GDKADFALIAASSDTLTTKKLQFGKAATASSTWNANTGRSKIEISTGAGFHAVGQVGNPTLIDWINSGSTYYTFVDSGMFTVQYASFTNMDENGIWLSGTGPFSINN